MTDVSISDLNSLVNTLKTMDWMGYLKLATFAAIILLFYAGIRKIRGKENGVTYNIKELHVHKK